MCDGVTNEDVSSWKGTSTGAMTSTGKKRGKGKGGKERKSFEPSHQVTASWNSTFTASFLHFRFLISRISLVLQTSLPQDEHKISKSFLFKFWRKTPSETTRYRRGTRGKGSVPQPLPLPKLSGPPPLAPNCEPLWKPTCLLILMWES